MAHSPDMQRTLAEAVEHHGASRLEQAEAMYRAVLQREPAEADALQFLGLLCYQRGRFDEAIALLSEAIEIRPNADAYVNLSQAYRAAGRIAESLAACERAVQRALQLPEAWNNLGTALSDVGRMTEAAEAFERAVQFRPTYAKALINLSAALLRLDRADRAEAVLRQAARVDPSRAVTWSDIGHLLARRQQHDEAIECYNRAIALDPHFAAAHNNLGNALFAIGRVAEAEAALRQAVELDPASAEAHVSLARLRTSQGRLDEAVELSRRAAAARPDLAAAHATLAAALQQQGLVDDAQAALTAALAGRWSNPQLPVALESTRISLMNYSPRASPREIFDAHVQWGRKYADPLLDPTPHANDRTPDRRLRIGYISPDFRKNPVSFFLERILANHDHVQFEITAYSSLQKPDEVTDRLRPRFDRWRDVGSTSDTDVAEQVRADEIDILVDLAGHNSGNRLGVLARKPAPVQATYLGYPNTTGVAAVNYWIGDEICDPVDEPVRSIEQIIRLPSGFCVYAPPVDAPPVSVSPAGTNNFITFGCFQSLAKLNSEVFHVWSDLLQRVENARLRLMRVGLEGAARDRVLDEFRRHGVSLHRLDLRGELPRGGHLAAYHDIDISLDVFPWCGHTTACESLWMGVPIVTLLGDRHAGRMVASVLSRLNLSEFIAHSREQYLDIAARLAADRTRLAHLRAELRTNLSQSEFCHGQTLTRELEAAYRQMWRAWCRQGH